VTAQISIPSSALWSVIDHDLTLDNLFNLSGIMNELYKCPHHSNERLDWSFWKPAITVCWFGRQLPARL